MTVMKKLSAVLILAFLCLCVRAQEGPLKDTFVNPLPLPDYPLGNWTQKSSPNMDRWLKGYIQDFRELADPSVIYADGKWIMYPSVSMAYVSEDFKTWTKHSISPEKIGDGYAPSVAEYRGKYYLIGCFSTLWVSDDPLGPFEDLGPVVTPEGVPINDIIFDPMLFADEDNLYLYWHKKGLFGAKLDSENPVRMTTEPLLLATSHPENEWERYGEYNEDPRRSFMEGVWMFRNCDDYYLTFASPGTANGTYATGTFVGKSPLGPFDYQPRNPVIRKAFGTVPGSGHGSIVRGPDGTLWAFTTSMVNNYHVFERRISLFPVGIDSEGNLFGYPARDIPQWAPGVLKEPHLGNEADYLPVSVRTIASATSCAPGRTADYAIDDYCRSWWQPAEDDRNPALTIDLKNRYKVAGIRIMWAEPELDHKNGVLPGPVRYRVLYQPKKGTEWSVALDCSENDRDMLVDYRTFVPIEARRLKLEILGTHCDQTVGVLEFTAFGKP